MLNTDSSVRGNFVKWIIKCCLIFVTTNKFNWTDVVVFSYYFMMTLYMNYDIEIYLQVIFLIYWILIKN